MKKILFIFLAFLLSLSFYSQTRIEVTEISDGDIVLTEDTEEPINPIETISFIGSDLLTKDQNLQVFRADGDTLEFGEPFLIVEYELLERILTPTITKATLMNGVVEIVPNKAVKSFAWELIVFFFILLVAVGIIQKVVVNSNNNTSVGGVVDGVVGVVVVAAAAVTALTAITAAITAAILVGGVAYVVVGGVVVVAAYVIVVATTVLVDLKSPKTTRNVLLAIWIVTQGIFSFHTFPNTEEVFFVVVGGIVCGWPSIYYWKAKKKRMETKKNMEEEIVAV